MTAIVIVAVIFASVGPVLAFVLGYQLAWRIGHGLPPVSLPSFSRAEVMTEEREEPEIELPKVRT